MHRLANFTSKIIYFQCIAENIFHKLLVHRLRTRGQVTSDYDQGEWYDTLREARWESCKNLSEYVYTNCTRLINAIVNGQLTRIACNDYFQYRTRMLVETLQRYATNENELVEIGSGAGRNMIALAYAGPWKSLLGLELSHTGREVTRRVCEWFDIQSVQTAHINLLDPNSKNFEKLQGAVVFSFYCLEQLPSFTRLVMENLLRAGVRRVIHIEPTTELFRVTSLKDLATISYIWRQDYQRTLLTTARALQKEGKVRLLACDRLHFASSCRNDPTLVVWEPTASSGGI